MTMEAIDPSEIRFFSGSSHPQLAADITRYLGVPLDKTDITRFSNITCTSNSAPACVRARCSLSSHSLPP